MSCSPRTLLVQAGLSLWAQGLGWFPWGRAPHVRCSLCRDRYWSSGSAVGRTGLYSLGTREYPALPGSGVGLMSPGVACPLGLCPLVPCWCSSAPEEPLILLARPPAACSPGQVCWHFWCPQKEGPRQR